MCSASKNIFHPRVDVFRKRWCVFCLTCFTVYDVSMQRLHLRLKETVECASVLGTLRKLSPEVSTPTSSPCSSRHDAFSSVCCVCTPSPSQAGHSHQQTLPRSCRREKVLKVAEHGLEPERRENKDDMEGHHNVLPLHVEAGMISHEVQI